MPDSFYAKITPVGPEGPVDPSYGRPGGGAAHPAPPIVLPPLPGVWPKPGEPSLPIVIPPEVAFPGVPSQPIYIDGTPTNPIALPPGEIWPPLPPDYAGKVVAVIILGEGKVHWYHVPPPSVNPKPPIPQPK